MKLIEELFKKYDLNKESLIPYGFKFQDDSYFLNKLIHNNQFELRITIIDEKIDAKLFELDFNEEYTGINLENGGSFINTLKDECTNILIDIRNNCFNKRLFIYSQSNRITKLIKDKYLVDPEYLWDTDPGFVVFRNNKSNKWFGIIMNIKRNKIVGISEEEIEVLNVMLKDKTIEYLQKDGIYPAYHMNKKNWVSIILDETLSDNYIMEFIDISYFFSEKNK